MFEKGSNTGSGIPLKIIEHSTSNRGDYNMLGEQVRNIRKSRGITLKVLAEQTGLSIGYISQIERNLTDPSLSTLRKISSALDVPTYLFMGEAEADNTLTTRKNQVITLSQPHSNIRYHLLTPMPSAEFVPQSLIIGFELEAYSKDGECPVIHPSEEIIMVQSGELDVIIGTERIHLLEGDSTLIRSNLPHIVENTTDRQTTGISVFTPAIWFPSPRRAEQNR